MSEPIAPLTPLLAQKAARALVQTELEALGLPVPLFKQASLDPARHPELAPLLDRGPVRVDQVLHAEVQGPEGPFRVLLPIAAGNVLPAELSARLPWPAPASALFTRAGWSAHPLLAEDPGAAAFIAALKANVDLGADLSWTRKLAQGSLTLDWTLQIVADEADSCLLLVRTGPTGVLEDRAGIEGLLARLRVLGALLSGWTGEVSLPVGVVAPCLALVDLPSDWNWQKAPAAAPSAAAPATTTPATAAPSPTPVAPAPAPPPAAAPTPSTPLPPAPRPTPQGISPLGAALCSLLLPGLGQALAGQSAKGLMLMVLFLFTCGLGGLLNLLVAADAWAVARRRQADGAVDPWSFFP